jgi:hypothetical protein
VLHDPGSQSIDGPSTVVVVDDDVESTVELLEASPVFAPQAPRRTEHETIEMIDGLNFENMIPPNGLTPY